MFTVTDLENTLPLVEYIIEANSNEQRYLWTKYKDHVVWESCPLGHGKTIGSLENRPVFMSFLYAEINGVVVLFWHLTSELADYKMAEDWLLENTNIKCKKDLHDATNNSILYLGGVNE